MPVLLLLLRPSYQMFPFVSVSKCRPGELALLMANPGITHVRLLLSQDLCISSFMQLLRFPSSETHSSPRAPHFCGFLAARVVVLIRHYGFFLEASPVYYLCGLLLAKRVSHVGNSLTHPAHRLRDSVYSHRLPRRYQSCNDSDTPCQTLLQGCTSIHDAKLQGCLHILRADAGDRLWGQGPSHLYPL